MKSVDFRAEFLLAITCFACKSGPIRAKEIVACKPVAINNLCPLLKASLLSRRTQCFDVLQLLAEYVTKNYPDQGGDFICRGLVIQNISPGGTPGKVLVDVCRPIPQILTSF